MKNQLLLRDLDQFYNELLKQNLSLPFLDIVDMLFERRRCYLFGAANMGQKFTAILQKLDIQIMGIADNNSLLWRTLICGVEVVNPNRIPYDDIIIVTSKYVKEINQQLQKKGYANILPHYVLSVYFPKEFSNNAHEDCREILARQKKEIWKAYKLLSDVQSKDVFLQLLKFRVTLDPNTLPEPMGNEYNPIHIWNYSANEVYVDVGAYNGDTLRQFLSSVGEEFLEYHAFEPDERTYNELISNDFNNNINNKLHFYNLGVGSENAVVSFHATGELDSHISESGNNTIEIVALDTFFKQSVPTTIKMDVEGYEAEVIKGAERIICEVHPKLAVCVYHKPTDLWTLLLEIHSLFSGYKFYLRHHDEEIYETVLYCI